MEKDAVIFVGHYRSFDKNYESFLKTFDNCDFYFHTWNTLNAQTNSYYGGPDKKTCYNPLTKEQIERLKLYDPDVIIESQTFTEEDLQDTLNRKPKKAVRYLWSALLKCLQRVKDSGKNYRSVIVSRYDIKYNNVSFKECPPRDTIYMGGRNWNAKIYALLANDIIFQFSFDNIDKFLSVDFEFGFSNPRVTCCEELYTLVFLKIFDKLSLKWNIYSDFEIIRI